MRKADALTKEYLSNNEIFADVFNYLIYDGQQRILPDYKLHLISCNNISDFTKFHTEFGRLMHILKVVSDEEKMDILLSDSDYSTLSVTAAQIINTFTGLHFSIPEKEETINMRNAWTDHKESGRKEGKYFSFQSQISTITILIQLNIAKDSSRSEAIPIFVASEQDLDTSE